MPVMVETPIKTDNVAHRPERPERKDALMLP